MKEKIDSHQTGKNLGKPLWKRKLLSWVKLGQGQIRGKAFQVADTLSRDLKIRCLWQALGLAWHGLIKH